MLRMFVNGAALAALLVVPALAAPKNAKKAAGAAPCCVTQTRCCDKVEFCCDQPDKAECCLKGVACCDKEPCCGSDKAAKKAGKKSAKARKATAVKACCKPAAK